MTVAAALISKPASRLKTPLLPALVYLAVLLAFVLRLYRITSQSLWYDEAYSVWLTTGAWAEVLQRIVEVDNHPPFYTLLLKATIAFAGDSELAVRYISVLSGTLATAVIARLAWRLGGWRLAAMAAWLAAASPFYVYYGQEARAYALALLMGALALDGAVRCLAAPSLRAWALLGCWVLVALYTHYAAGMVIAALATVLAGYTIRELWRGAGVVSLRGPLAAAVLVTVGYAPWLGVALQAVGRDSSYYEGALPLLPVLNGLWLGFAGAISENGEPSTTLLTFVVALLLLSVLGAAAALRAGGAQIRAWLIVIAVLVMPVLAYAFLQQLVPKFHPRYLMLATPAVYLLAAAGVLALARWRGAGPLGPGLALASLVVVAVGWFSQLQPHYAGTHGPRDDWRSVAALLQAERAPADPVVVLSGYGRVALRHYLPDDSLIPLPDTPVPLVNRSVGTADLRRLDGEISGAQRLWLVEWQPTVMDPSGQLEQALGQAMSPLLDRTFNGIRVRAFLPSGRSLVSPLVGQGLAANFADVLSLEAVQVPAAPVASGEMLSVQLRWRTLQNPQRNYKVALKLLDQQRQEWGRLDARPAGELNVTRRWQPGAEFSVDLAVPIQAGAPPGRYSLELQVYDEETLAQVPATVGLGATSPLVTIGDVSVAGAPTAPAALEPLTHVRAESNGLRLTGFRFPDAPLPAGDTVQVTLAWEVVGSGALQARLRLEGLGASSTTPVLPSEAWSLTQPGDRFLTIHTLPTEPEANGPAQITGWLDGLEAFNFPVTVQGRPRAYQPPSVPRLAGVVFGDAITLYGYGVEAARVQQGAVIPVRLVWHTPNRPTARLKAFVHLVDSNGSAVAQHDSEPANDTLPTPRWAAGEYVEDVHQLQLPANMPPGTYRLRVGLYLWPDGPPLPLASGEAFELPEPVTIERR